MGFGQNPHVAKAEAAEQKAQCARDASAHEQAWREAARQWERAAERETNDARRSQYTEKADAARENASNPPATEGAEAAQQSSDAKAAAVLRLIK